MTVFWKQSSKIAEVQDGISEIEQQYFKGIGQSLFNRAAKFLKVLRKQTAVFQTEFQKQRSSIAFQRFSEIKGQYLNVKCCILRVTDKATVF